MCVCQWVEIYNPHARGVSTNGMALMNPNGTFARLPATWILPPRHYLLVLLTDSPGGTSQSVHYHEGVPFYANGTGDVDVPPDVGILGNEEDVLVLMLEHDGHVHVMDAVVWSDGAGM